MGVLIKEPSKQSGRRHVRRDRFLWGLGFLIIATILLLTVLKAGRAAFLAAQSQMQQASFRTFAAVAVRRFGLTDQQLSATCLSKTFSKQACLFSNVCLRLAQNSLQVVLPGHSRSDDRELLQQQLNATLAGVYNISFPTTSQPMVLSNTALWDEHAVTVLWRANSANHESFGHALVNEAFPIFMVLRQFFNEDIPQRLQLLVHSWWHEVLQHVYLGTISSSTLLISARLDQIQAVGSDTLCFPQLLLGDGGYIMASRHSLTNAAEFEAQAYTVGPSFFSSNDWWHFRRHTLQVSGVVEESAQILPLILLNDKRYGVHATADRRMIMDIDRLATDIQAAYPKTEVVVARFRDLPWTEQLRLISRARIFITTQGSSAFRLVFLPKGATCIMIGAPDVNGTRWQSFHELDKWFSLTYVRFKRYNVSASNSAEFQVNVIPGHWQPDDPKQAHDWWMYNADVRLDMHRLQPLIGRALSLLPS